MDPLFEYLHVDLIHQAAFGCSSERMLISQEYWRILDSAGITFAFL